MNCACNRFKTCTECRNAYKETVKRERQILDVIEELEARSCISEDWSSGKAYEEAVLLIRNVMKND